MTNEINEELLERHATALKENMGLQMSAEPLHGSDEDWHAEGGVIYFNEMAKAALSSLKAGDVVGPNLMVVPVDVMKYMKSTVERASIREARYETYMKALNKCLEDVREE